MPIADRRSPKAPRPGPDAPRPGLRPELPWATRLLPLALLACTPTDDAVDDGEPTLAETLGMNRYEGESEGVVESEDGTTTTWRFEDTGRARCLRGDPFRMATRPGASNDLLIFLQGGGMCSPEFCLAVTKAPAGIPGVDILLPDLPENPARDWNVAYAPYCDGSLFIGDKDHHDDDDGTDDRLHRGLANVTATLDIARATFDAPERVLFAGSSGGGFGAALLSPLVRHYFPDAELIVLADSAVGVARGDADPGFVDRLVDQFDAASMIPEDCPDCTAGGHITGFFDWYLGKDDQVRVGVYSTWYDFVISGLFLDVPPADFRDDLQVETGRIHDAFPDRYRRFIQDGSSHTALLGNPIGIIGNDLTGVEVPDEVFSELLNLEIGGIVGTEVDGYLFADWLVGLVDGDLDGWQDTLEEPGAPPERD